MPWPAKAAKRHTKKAKGGKCSRQWAHVANSMLDRTGDEGKAVRAANSKMKSCGHKLGSKKKRKNGRRKR